MKILVSPNYGAGWSSWCSEPDARMAVLTDAALIEHIEHSDTNGEPHGLHEDHPLVVDLVRRIDDAHDYLFYAGGVRDLIVVNVYETFIIVEYDGYESVALRSKFNWIHPED